MKIAVHNLIALLMALACPLYLSAQEKRGLGYASEFGAATRYALAYVGGGSGEPAAASTSSPRDFRSIYDSAPLLAVKTNLLFDLVTLLNLEAEVPIGDQWSVNGEFYFPWWVDKQSNSFALQIMAGSLDGRYWLGERASRRVLTGHFVGLYTGAGYYDIQLSRSSGYQGEFFIAAGVTYGYAIPVINDKFSLEFSVGIGYLSASYKHYNVEEGGAILAHDYSGKRTWFGPTKLKVSFSWLLYRKSKTQTEW